MQARRVELIFLTLFSTCATLNQKELFQRVEQFNLLMRWRRFEDASIFVLKEKRNEFLEYYGKLSETLYFNDISIISSDVNEKEKTALIKVYVLYYIYPDIVEKKRVIEQKWIWKDKGWFLEEGLFIR
jgi:hypothetical protein